MNAIIEGNSILNHAISIEDLIIKLQALAVANPGIKVLANDCEHGVDSVSLTVQPCFHDASSGGNGIRLSDDDIYKNIVDGIKYFSSNTPESLWLKQSSYNKTEYYKNDFQQFLKEHNAGLAHHTAEKIKLDNAVECLIISIM